MQKESNKANLMQNCNSQLTLTTYAITHSQRKKVTTQQQVTNIVVESVDFV